VTNKAEPDRAVTAAGPAQGSTGGPTDGPTGTPPPPRRRLRGWLGSPPLFWRTFLLIILLIVSILAAWVQSFRVFERGPRARQVAAQVVSIVNITRTALLYSDPVQRRALLDDLADNEGVRVAPLEAGDRVVPYASTELTRLIAEHVGEELGQRTRLAAAVNGVTGLWVSFDIEGDAYWVLIDRSPLAPGGGRQWIGWAAVSTVLSLLAAVAITRAVNRPLAALSRAATRLGAGQSPEALPETGPAEIQAVNRSFNRMVADLDKLEQDRVVLLAGISHDLRTPLARLRLEVEIQPLPEATRAAMVGDLEQMNAIVAQFLAYARPMPQEPPRRLPLAQVVSDSVAASRLDLDPSATLEVGLDDRLEVDGHPTELRRAVDNLLTNAAHYGRAPDGALALRVTLARERHQAVLTIADRGPGVPAEDAGRLLRPFERGNEARSDGAGAGLGLSIVDRIARLHGGTLQLAQAAPHGLACVLRIPLASAARA
jgi:two-component system, OmpR family, osmolarity sensor histidine kinase EnvZ